MYMEYIYYKELQLNNNTPHYYMWGFVIDDGCVWKFSNILLVYKKFYFFSEKKFFSKLVLDLLIYSTTDIWKIIACGRIWFGGGYDDEFNAVWYTWLNVRHLTCFGNENGWIGWLRHGHWSMFGWLYLFYCIQMTEKFWIGYLPHYFQVKLLVLLVVVAKFTTDIGMV